MSKVNRFVSVAIPSTEIEAIDGPVAVLEVPMRLAESGFENCSMWVTTQLMYLANKVGRTGIHIVKTETVIPDDPAISQVIKMYGVRVQDYVFFEERAYGSAVN
jgi:hypothetical protein